ncbi:MAG: cupin domain-containing protein [Chloroflexi bacterium]|nr:cupin domain-containing protein [Chloroflexota bacterium]
MAIQIVETTDLQNSLSAGVGLTPLIDAGRVRALALDVAAGHGVAPCRMSLTVLYYVVEGQGHLRVGDEQAELRRGSLAVVPAGAVRSISAVAPMRVLAVQVL